MKRREETVGEKLDRAMGLFRKPSPELMASVQERVSQRLEAEPRVAFQEKAWPSNPARKSQWFAVATMAAAIVVAVLIPIAVMQPGPAVLEEVMGSRKIDFGEVVYANGAANTLVLADGSRVEMRSKSELFLERADDGVRVRLRNGGIIVNAAKQRRGHLYVQTKDVTVSVVGTVFLVNTEEEGSRVAVIEGEVRVQQQGAAEKKLGPGQQVTTNPKMESISVKEELHWSRQAVAHVAMLEQATAPLAPAPKEERLAFEVASIRPAVAVSTPGPNARGGGGGNGRPGGMCIGGVQLDPRRLRVTRAPLFEIVAFAYGDCFDMVGDPLNIIRPFPRLSSVGQDWIKSDRWDIEALIPEGSLGPPPATVSVEPGEKLMLNGSPVQKMLRALLEECFKVVVRRETKEMPVYVLTVGPNGTKFQGKDFEYGVQVVTAAMLPPGTAPGTVGALVHGGTITALTAATGAESAGIHTGPCLNERLGPNPCRAMDGIYTNMLMDGVAQSLSGDARTVIFNRTGIQERVSFAFEMPRRRFVGTIPEPYTFQELAKGLEAVGLKLTEDKGPVEFFVIERAEKPSEN